MKKLRITLNEKVYEVTVEVLEDDESHYPGVPMSPTAPGFPRKQVPAPETSTTPTRRPAAPPSTVAGNSILAPIAGTVTKILVEPQMHVKENQPLIVLDAMKMDTYINATRSGVVLTIDCKVGDSVHVGQKLLSVS